MGTCAFMSLSVNPCVCVRVDADLCMHAHRHMSCVCVSARVWVCLCVQGVAPPVGAHMLMCEGYMCVQVWTHASGVCSPFSAVGSASSS